MITADPQQRAARLEQVLDLLRAQAAAEDRELLLALAPVVYAETPDRVALGFSPEALAARLYDQFRFVVREMPPPLQLYKGLPGLHVVVRNPEPAAWVSRGPADGMPHEVTLVETHTPDAPFIFESLKNYFRKAGIRVFSTVHPIITVRRQWERIVWVGDPHAEGSREVYCHFQIERIDSKERLRHIEHQIFALLKCVFTSVEDFEDMRRAVQELIPRLRPRRGDEAGVGSARAFLGWLLADNYVFQGIVRYRLDAAGVPQRIQESAAGVFTDAELLPVVFPGLIEEVESNLAPGPHDERVVDIDYQHNASAIHHLEPLDDVVVRVWAPDGSLEEALLLQGRFAKGAFTQKAQEVPLLREKLAWILDASDALPGSHFYREARALFNRLPARELFYAGAASLKKLVSALVFMTSDEEIAVQVRPGNGYVALAVAFSRLRYSYTVEAALKRAFSDAFGPITFSLSQDLGGVMLLLFYFQSEQLEHQVEADQAQHIVADLVTTWEDKVERALEREFGEREGRRLFERYVRAESRSGLYRESTPPEEVPGDIEHLEQLQRRLEVRILSRSARSVALKLFSARPLALTEILSTLHNLGLTVTEEMRLPLVLPEGRHGTLYRLEIEAPSARLAALHIGSERFVEALRALDEGRASDDPLNGLILSADLSWREVEVLRTLRNHLLQIRTHYNVETVNGVLLRNARVAGAIQRAFAARFDPAISGDRQAGVAEADAVVGATLDAVRSLAEDEVLRGLANLVRSALRTNFYQRPERPVIAIKVDSRKVEGMPSPRPMFEIYVHSRLLEGVHLRGGKVARGGIRWSDRHDDFRIEILGLMKTQMVKNAIIVPVGAKGGFVLKGNLPTRPALDQYLIDRYREFVSGLLDVTDNIVDGQVLHPPEVVRHDGDDPYLVVAADKGTAHLSDTANSVSAQYGFWLGDAFASGGSAGYDHKKMGITARGAWECVKHHFRNLGHDVQTQPFTTAGIGDMSGDVFGNGVLLSPAMKLVAAFNHLHIFIDPDPDPGRSLAERKRLFELPRSGWRDYDPGLISRGGGVFDRSAKAIPLSPEVRALLQIQDESASGEEVIRRILTSRVDLLYNGGIGTYLKASSEDDADVGDRANDRVRVDAQDVRARVMGEGGNLGCTQRARLEYWAAGGSINTDAIDNSGGVDTSDHEVNIKILMNILIKEGKVKGREERNRILAEMTEEVAALVLADNANQARCLTLDGLRSAARYEEFDKLVGDMVGAGILNRDDDAIPTRAELLANPHRERGLPRPLLCVLLGHTKMWAFQSLLETAFPDGPVGAPFLDAYFPRRLQAFRDVFPRHALHREIVATAAVNHLVNCTGIAFLFRNGGAAALGDVVGAWVELDRASGAPELRSAVLAAGWPAADQHAALLRIEDALEAVMREALAGGKPDAARALAPIRERLKQ